MGQVILPRGHMILTVVTPGLYISKFVRRSYDFTLKLDSSTQSWDKMEGDKVLFGALER